MVERKSKTRKQKGLKMKYIVKAYDYNGNFYGYASPHPDDPENKSFSYYVDDIKEAKIFDSYIEADNYIERFEDGSELTYEIIEL